MNNELKAKLALLNEHTTGIRRLITVNTKSGTLHRVSASTLIDQLETMAICVIASIEQRLSKVQSLQTRFVGRNSTRGVTSAFDQSATYPAFQSMCHGNGTYENAVVFDPIISRYNNQAVNVHGYISSMPRSLDDNDKINAKFISYINGLSVSLQARQVVSDSRLSIDTEGVLMAEDSDTLCFNNVIEAIVIFGDHLIEVHNKANSQVATANVKKTEDKL